MFIFQNPDTVFAVVTWLGWINSCMNPVIYACCSNEFRRYVIYANNECSRFIIDSCLQ
jgi:hypothetical protein